MNWDSGQIKVLDAPQVDGRNGIALGIRAFTIRMNTALGAEAVPDDVLVERVRTGRSFGCSQTQTLPRNEPEQRAFAGADGTVAGQSAVDLSLHVE